METTQVTVGERVISLAIRRHSRARRISLRLSPARDAIVMTLPRRSSVDAGMKFFSSKSKWVLENVQPEAMTPLTDSAIIPLLGQECVIIHRPGRGVARLMTHDSRLALLIHGTAEFTPRRVRDFLKKHLHRECLKRARLMAAHIGKQVREVKIRDTRSRWGSCSAKGTLTFNLRLVFAPSEILDYLIAHEVAHLVEMNHSPRFWNVVAALCPDFERARRWIKKEGHKLHRYG